MVLSLLAGTLALVFARGCAPGHTDARAVDCGAVAGNVVVVDTAAHRLALCESGASAADFRVRIGKNGTGKRREGDGKTPLGRYPLGAPRASAAYGTFIPVGYPTDAQRAEGYTGSAVGVHGPHRGVVWMGDAVNAFDTTEGCVGVANDDEMQHIVAWLGTAHPREIVLR